MSTLGAGAGHWQLSHIMRQVGHRIVLMHDERGKRFEQIAENLNGEGLYYRDCSMYSCKPWDEAKVREYYKAARAGWPIPKRVNVYKNRPTFRDKAVLPPLPSYRVTDRKIRPCDIEHAEYRAKKALEKVETLKKFLGQKAVIDLPSTSSTDPISHTSSEHRSQTDDSTGAAAPE